MKHGFSALALTALLAGPVAAQDSTLSGTVAEVFDRQIVLAAPEGRMLVTLPDDATVPEAGPRAGTSPPKARTSGNGPRARRPRPPRRHRRHRRRPESCRSRCGIWA